MVELDQTHASVLSREPVSFPKALAVGFLTAILAGEFALVLMMVDIVQPNPTEWNASPKWEFTPQLLHDLWFLSIWAVGFAIAVAWLPISVVGWAFQRLARDRPWLWHPVSHILVGSLAGPALLAVTGMLDLRFDGRGLAFGVAVGTFAAFCFRFLTRPNGFRIG